MFSRENFRKYINISTGIYINYSLFVLISAILSLFSWLLLAFLEQLCLHTAQSQPQADLPFDFLIAHHTITLNTIRTATTITTISNALISVPRLRQLSKQLFCHRSPTNLAYRYLLLIRYPNSQRYPS